MATCSEYFIPEILDWKCILETITKWSLSCLHNSIALMRDKWLELTVYPVLMRLLTCPCLIETFKLFVTEQK